MNLTNSTPVLYLKSHIFKSTESAVKLAEISHSEKNIKFADNLLKVKESIPDVKLNKMSMYNGQQIKKSEKYADLSQRIKSVKKDQYSQNKDTETTSGSAKHSVTGRTHCDTPPPLPPRNNSLPVLPPRASSPSTVSNDVVKPTPEVGFNALAAKMDSIPRTHWAEYDSQIHRFKDVRTAKETQIITSTGHALAANQIKVDKENLAIRCQYPKNIEHHMRMLLDKKPVMGIVLSSDHDFLNQSLKLTPYFKEKGAYADMSVESGEIDLKDASELEGLHFKAYDMAISAGDKKCAIPVMHVKDWPDRNAISAKALVALGERVMETLQTLKQVHKDIAEQCRKQLETEKKPERRKNLQKSIEEHESYEPQPFVHCNAGVGRTGALLVVLQLLKANNTLTVDEIIMQIRKTGSQLMVQTPKQYESLLGAEVLINAMKADNAKKLPV